MRLISYNIRFGGQEREILLAKTLYNVNPDLVILQEATNPQVVEKLAHELGMSFWVARKGYSLALLSHLPIIRCDWHHTKWLKHPFLEAVIEAFPLRVFGVHLQPYFSKWSEQKRVREIQSVLEVISKHRTVPHLLTGDFNAIAPGDDVKVERMPTWIRFLIWLNGGYIPREAIKTLLQFGYVDGFRKLHPNRDGFTLPTPIPHVRLDYVFLPSFLSTYLKECLVVKDPSIISQASDHYPLLATIEI